MGRGPASNLPLRQIKVFCDQSCFTSIYDWIIGDLKNRRFFLLRNIF